MTSLIKVSKRRYPKIGRTSQAEVVKAGVYMIEHVATGRFYLGMSKGVTERVSEMIQLLEQGKHPCKLLNKLFEKDDELLILEYPASTEKARKALVKDILDSVTTPYLYLNDPEFK